MNRRIYRWLQGLAAIALVAAIASCRPAKAPQADRALPAKPQLEQRASPPPVLTKVVINEAARTLLYLPLYHAIEKGYFRNKGIEVKVVTGGSATAAFAAMLSGEAEFAQADPMYVPISREKGAETKVVAQVVGRIALWGLTLNSNVTEMTVETLKGKKIATHPKPMTAFTYTTKYIHDLGMDSEKDAEVLTSAPGTEIAALMSKQADFMVTIEPNASKAVAQGAHVILSFPHIFGDQVLTGLMTREKYIKENRNVVIAVVRAYQEALDDLRANPASAMTSAKRYFPQLDETILRQAIQRLIDEEVFPRSVIISDESWNKAVAVRVEVGDLKESSSRAANCDLTLLGETQSK